MCNPGHADELRVVVDYVNDPPVADSNAPLIPEALQLFAPCGPGVIPERFHLAHGPRQHGVWQTFEFFPRRRLYLNEVATHEDARVESGLP